MFVAVAVAAAPSGPSGNGDDSAFGTIFVVHLVTMVWILALTAFYVVNVFRNPRVAENQRALWAVVIFLGNVFAMPVYSYLYIWRAPASATTRPTSSATA